MNLSFGALGFASPWLLAFLLALPILWIILRAVPPAAVRRRFPALVLILGLKDKEHETERTPWWLLLLRMAALALVILGFAGPILHPRQIAESAHPLLIVSDASFAEAAEWTRHIDRAERALEDAAAQSQSVALLSLTQAQDVPVVFASPAETRRLLADFAPQAWRPEAIDTDALLANLPDRFDTLWLTGGVDFAGKSALAAALQTRGSVTVFQPATSLLALGPTSRDETSVTLPIRALPGALARTISVLAIGPDPAGSETVLAQVSAEVPALADRGEAIFKLQSEIRNRISRFEIEGQGHAAAVLLADDALKRREVALVSAQAEAEGLELLSPLHFLREALREDAEVIEGALSDMIEASPDVIILADVASLPQSEQSALEEWVTAGGLLVRFAGPRVAASDLSRSTEDALMPVRLRVGGRSIGGAMSWGEPRRLRDFEPGTPFFGLNVPDDVTVTSQVLAQPDPDLAARTIAALEDGTPLVTRKTLGNGQVVFFHITANAEYSNLPLSFLFVQMLTRLSVVGLSEETATADLAEQIFAPVQELTASGRLIDAGTREGIAGEVLAVAHASDEVRPGLYQSPERALALNVMGRDDMLVPVAWPSGIRVESGEAAVPQPLKAWLLAAALALLSLDVLGTLLVAGRLVRRSAGVHPLLAVVIVGLLTTGIWPGGVGPLIAQDSERARAEVAQLATDRVVLAYVLTGDPEIDAISLDGLRGLSEVLTLRTSIEPGPPQAVDPETDELAFYPFLYWPVVRDQRLPSDAAYVRLNRYLQTGGMILFDTGDGDLNGSAAQEHLQLLASGLDVPPLEPVPSDHVLTRAFYLLQEFPGRVGNPTVWVEAAPPDAALAEGMPFRNLNDGVTPVVIGGGDWARAWALSEEGYWQFPVGTGSSGERQRELALRFGVNLIMHVLTGNYKSDQVHVPALLERLGQ